MIGIRREDKNRWERRAPLTPDHVARLVEDHGLAFRVEESARRVFPDLDYQKAGAELDGTLAGCRIVLGVKEIPPEQLQADRVYLYFSHTTKGQAANMPALRRLLELGSTLLDYEHVIDDAGRRLIYFGKHAGYAGMIDALWALGKRLAAEGIETVFDDVRLAHDYSGLDEATHHLTRLGEKLRHTGLPDDLRPLAVGFTGSGNVAEGAQEIFDRLPTVEVRPEELPGLGQDADRPRNVLYKVVFRRDERYARVDGGAFDPNELATRPERYRSGLTRWLPHLTMLIHGAYWDPAHPRLVSAADLRALWAGATAPRLRVIADVSCDVGGGVEATVRATTPGEPVYVWDAAAAAPGDGLTGPGPLILAVDNLPCQLPAEASEHFGDALARFLPALARCDWTVPLDALALPEPLRRAVVTHRGELTPAFSYLREPLAAGGAADRSP